MLLFFHWYSKLPCNILLLTTYVTTPPLIQQTTMPIQRSQYYDTWYSNLNYYHSKMTQHAFQSWYINNLFRYIILIQQQIYDMTLRILLPCSYDTANYYKSLYLTSGEKKVPEIKSVFKQCLCKIIVVYVIYIIRIWSDIQIIIFLTSFINDFAIAGRRIVSYDDYFSSPIKWLFARLSSLDSSPYLKIDFIRIISLPLA